MKLDRYCEKHGCQLAPGECARECYLLACGSPFDEPVYWRKPTIDEKLDDPRRGQAAELNRRTR